MQFVVKGKKARASVVPEPVRHFSHPLAPASPSHKLLSSGPGETPSSHMGRRHMQSSTQSSASPPDSRVVGWLETAGMWQRQRLTLRCPRPVCSGREMSIRVNFLTWHGFSITPTLPNMEQHSETLICMNVTTPRCAVSPMRWVPSSSRPDPRPCAASEVPTLCSISRNAPHIARSRWC